MIKVKHSDLLGIVTKAYLFADNAKTAQIPYNLIRILKEKNRISATCSNASVICTFSCDCEEGEGFDFAVNAARFFDVIKNWQASEEINFQIHEGKVTLKAKSKKVNISCVPDEGYWAGRGPSGSHSFVFDAAEAKKIIGAVSFSSSKTAFDVVHRCLLIESIGDNQVVFAAHEGFRMASLVTKNDTLSGSFRVLVEADTINAALRSFGGEEQIYFTVGQSRVDIFNSNSWVGVGIIPAKYPDISRVRSMSYPYSYKVKSSDITSISKSISSVIRNTDRPRNARFSVAQDGIRIFAATDEGDVEDILPSEVVLGEPFDDTKGCDIVYFAEPCQFFSSFILHTGPDKKHGYIFTTEELEGWSYHLLATR
jgi:DNA polymerase III sliding clamp (beta) subunit (PCNA family)